MPSLFSTEFNSKFDGAVDDKENSSFKDKIAISLSDPQLQEEWISLKSSKTGIKDELSYNSYIKSISEFFNKVCEKITAPGVDAFMDWIGEFEKRNDTNLGLL